MREQVFTWDVGHCEQRNKVLSPVSRTACGGKAQTWKPRGRTASRYSVNERHGLARRDVKQPAKRYQRFGGTRRLHVPGIPSEMSVPTDQTPWHRVPQDHEPDKIQSPVCEFGTFRSSCKTAYTWPINTSIISITFVSYSRYRCHESFFSDVISKTQKTRTARHITLT
jgi:hypothetical protein